MDTVNKFFSDPTTPEEKAQKDLKYAQEIARQPAMYPNTSAKDACYVIAHDFPEIWRVHSKELAEIAIKAEMEHIESAKHFHDWA
jgi:hypothetical protein